MLLIDNWRDILRRAWSIRLIIVAGALTGIEVALPLFGDAVPRGIFAALSMVTSIGALGARLTAQRGLDAAEDK
jgi:hypothetical protein